jgi:hypothetical protein
MGFLMLDIDVCHGLAAFSGVVLGSTWPAALRALVARLSATKGLVGFSSRVQLRPQALPGTGNPPGLSDTPAGSLPCSVIRGAGVPVASIFRIKPRRCSRINILLLRTAEGSAMVI